MLQHSYLIGSNILVGNSQRNSSHILCSYGTAEYFFRKYMFVNSCKTYQPFISPNVTDFQANVKLYYILQIPFLKLPILILSLIQTDTFTEPQNSSLVSNNLHATIATSKFLLPGEFWEDVLDFFFDY